MDDMKERTSTKELIKRIQEDDAQAIQILCEDEENRNLVKKIAKEIAGKYSYGIGKNNIFEMDDLINAGFIGMIEAAKKFDLSKENKFSTYAGWWIKKRVIEVLRSNKDILSISAREKEMIRKVMKKEQQYSMTELNKQKRIELIAEDLGITTDKVNECFTADYQMRVSSLDEPYGEDDDTCQGDHVTSKLEEDLDSQIANKDLQISTKGMLNLLDEQERRVIAYRLGLDGDVKSYEEVASLMGLSMEKVRVLEARALIKLDRISKKQGMRDYLC